MKRLGATGGGLVVAVSGGPDSVALLRALLALWPSRGGRPLVIAHLNHLLRGGESDDDEEFVRALHAEAARQVAGVRLCSGAVAVAARARDAGDNLEKIARQTRYAWLAEVAEQQGCSHVATGHTADDQAETVLHRLIRGTGIRGLRGIAHRRSLAADVFLVRPLLAVSRAEVLEYLQNLGQTYRLDSSNRDPAFTRNRIRGELLPLLRQYNPQIDAVLGRLSEQAAAAHERAESRASQLLHEAERPRAGHLLVFDRKCLAAAPRSLVREVLRLAWQREGWPESQMGYASWDRLANLVFAESGAVDLPSGIRARSRGRVVQLGKPR